MADEITGIAAAEALDRRREIDLAIDNAKREITTAIQRLAAHWQINLERGQAKTRVDDLKKRMENITERLREEGVSAAHIEIIADAPRYARGRSYLTQVNKHVETELQRLSGLLGLVLQIPMDQFADINTFPELDALTGTLDTTRASKVLGDAADQVVNKSSGLLKARLKRDPAPAEYVKAICGLMDNAHVPDAEARCTTWITEAIAEAQQSAWSQICSSLMTIYEAQIAAGKPAEPTEHIIALIREFLVMGGNVTARQIARIYMNLGDATVGAVLSAKPNDFIIMTYVDEGRDIAFSQASPGQQASALLELLLHQSAGTLIIDQPEDDLDNRIIMRIVALIRTSKNHRQLIFATHNPNIVVNGDADKVIALRSGDPAMGAQIEMPRVQLFTDGAIETADVRVCGCAPVLQNDK